MSKTTCPHCGAKEHGAYIPDVTSLRWECGSWEINEIATDECRIRRLQDEFSTLQSAWVGMGTALALFDYSDSKEETEIMKIIGHWEDDTVFIPGKDEL
jgi:hypothetical protein